MEDEKHTEKKNFENKNKCQIFLVSINNIKTTSLFLGVLGIYRQI